MTPQWIPGNERQSLCRLKREPGKVVIIDVLPKPTYILQKIIDREPIEKTEK